MMKILLVGVLMTAAYMAGYYAAELQNRAEALENAVEQGNANRQEEHRQAKAVTGISNDTEINLQKARADAAAASAAADRLRDKLATTAAREQSRFTAEHQTRTRAELLYADLFRRADERAGELAAYADRQTVKLNACVRAYDSVTGTHNEQTK